MWVKATMRFYIQSADVISCTKITNQRITELSAYCVSLNENEHHSMKCLKVWYLVSETA